jgi:hypothetical protein
VTWWEGIVGNYITRGFMNFTTHQILFGRSRALRLAGHVERVEDSIVYWASGVGPGNLRIRDHLEDLGVDGRIIIKMDLSRIWM